MRVLVASGTWYPARNGVARVATEVAHNLALRGHEVSALVPRVAGLPTAERRGSLTVRRVIERGWIPLTITDVLEIAKQARGLGPFDVVLAHGPTALVGLSRARLSAPLAYVFHASHSRELRFMRARLPWGRERLVAYLNEPLSLVAERAAGRRSARIFVLSEYSRTLFTEDHPEHHRKVRLVSGGVDTDSFCPADGMRAARARLGIEPTRRMLVTVRRAEPRMGLDELLRAVALLEGDVTLAVVGGGMLSGELRRLCVDLGLDGRVSFTGVVREDELYDWYRAADLFVLPTVAYEGFGMVTVEALASGTPVVGTPVGATPELLLPLDPRLVAADADVASLTAAIRAALEFIDAGLRVRCREYALARFDWGPVVSQWERALADVVESAERERQPRPAR
jgi:glycosyltransferase involved in cell wall biosynthesis